jgi:putative ABC transport system permease protein
MPAMTLWQAGNEIRRAPRRLGLAALAVALPVALLSATLLFVDVAVHSMTRLALQPVQVEMRVLAPSLNTNLTAMGSQLSSVHGVRRVERFAAAEVVVGTAGSKDRATARLFAVDPGYLTHHPWVGAAGGSLQRGALLNGSLKSAPGLGTAHTVTVGLRGQQEPLVSVPVSGTADLRRATTWFQIPAGDVQGDIAVVPRAIVIDYATFDRLLRPALVAALGATTPVLNPGLTDLPPVDLEAHVTVDHNAYPTDPGSALVWSAGLRHALERRAGTSVVVADDAAEALTFARDDAANAKILFLLLGIPGVLVAAILGLAAESALAEARRREESLMRLRGATDRQLARLTAAHAAVAGVLGGIAGIALAIVAVSVIHSRAIWQDIPAARLAFSLALALAAGAVIVIVRVARVVRAGRRSEVVADRSVLERGWTPTWRRARLDALAITVGIVILGLNALVGGLKATPIEGPVLALSFYVLLAPILLWIGVSLLAVRGLLAALGRLSRPDAARPLRSWRGAALRWLGRRPARTAVVLVLGTLAVAFGTEVISFVATYSAAKQADARAAFGSDLHLTPSTEAPVDPGSPPGVAATTPVRYVPARVGSDRKTILMIDVPSYTAASTVQPRMLSGQGYRELQKNRYGVLVAPEIARGFAVGPGDSLPVTVFPDDQEKSRIVNLKVVGVLRSFAPTEPLSEMVMSTAALRPFLWPAPETYLARVADGHDQTATAAELRHGSTGSAFQVTTLVGQSRADQRTLTSLNLAGLGSLESIGAGLVAALGIAVLIAFLVLERRREFAVLRALGADTPRLLTGPGLEGAAAMVGSIVLGIPIGLGLAVVAVRVLGLFFTQPPPVLTFAPLALGAFGLLVLLTSTLTLAAALIAVTRVAAAAVLREQ